MKDNLIITYKNFSLKIGYNFFLTENRYVNFWKNDGDSIHVIGGGDMDFLRINNIASSICFKKVEMLLGYEINETPEFPRTFRSFNFNNITGVDLQRTIVDELPFQMECESDINMSLSLFERYIKEAEMVFFNRYKTIDSLLPYLEVPFDDFLSLNKVFTKDSVLKKMIIWKLTNHQDFEEFSLHHIYRLEELFKSNPSKSIKKSINRIKKLKVRLDKYKISLT